MISPTHGKVSNDKMLELIIDYINMHPLSKSTIAIGTDSQENANVVVVIAVYKQGIGGIFFYEKSDAPVFKSLRTKIYYETQKSLELASSLIQSLSTYGIDKEIEIHTDIGHYGKTKELINEIAGWVRAEGYTCITKPNSYVASSIADKLSK